jgi:uncharacterized protein YbaR (Trm112 family)
MRKDLLDILCCPICKEKLELEVIEEREDRIVTGTLTCVKCGEKYPIEEEIPNMLPPDLR